MRQLERGRQIQRYERVRKHHARSRIPQGCAEAAPGQASHPCWAVSQHPCRARPFDRSCTGHACPTGTSLLGGLESSGPDSPPPSFQRHQRGAPVPHTNGDHKRFRVFGAIGGRVMSWFGDQRFFSLRLHRSSSWRISMVRAGHSQLKLCMDEPRAQDGTNVPHGLRRIAHSPAQNAMSNATSPCTPTW